jgi:hypothetical protein
VQYRIESLGNGVLGLTFLGSSVVALDAAAGGYGWFVGTTAAGGAFGSVVAAQEMQASPDSPAFGKMDLLTVVEHELGHVLGLGDLDPTEVPHDLLTQTLAAGVRRLPAPAGPADLPVATVPTATVVPQESGRVLLANLAQPQAAQALAPPLSDRPAIAGEFDVVSLTVPQDPGRVWPGATAAFRPPEEQGETRSDNLFLFLARSQPHAAAQAFAPPPSDRPAVADGLDVAYLAAPLDPDAAWASAAAVVGPPEDQREAGSDDLFLATEPVEYFDLPRQD